MAAGGGTASAMDVDSRVTCSVCLEFYRGRRPKLLHCFHTLCEPCIVQLTCPSQGDKQATVTCPNCRAIHPLPPGGASALQANFYIDDIDATDTATQPDDSAMPVTQQDDEPSDDLQVKVKEQVKVMEAVTSRLSEEEKEIERQKKAMELTIRQRYEAGQRLLDESHDQCLRSVEEVSGQLTDKLQADLMFADSLLKPLQALAREGSSRAQSRDPGPAPPPALLTDAVLRHFRTMSTASQQPSASLFSYHYADNTAHLTASLRRYMGTVAPSGGGISLQLAGGGQGKTAGQGAGDDLGVTAGDGQVLANQQQQQQLRAVQTAVNQVQADNDQLSKELSGFRQSVSDHMAAVNRDLPAVRSHVDHLKTEQAIVTTQVDSLRSDMGTATTDIGSLQKDMTAATTDIGSLQKDMTAATKDIGSLQKDMAAATTDIGSLQKDMTAATTDIGSLQNAMTAATTDIGSLQKDMTAATTNIGSLQKDMTAATTDIGSLQKDMTAATTDIGSLQKDMTAATTDIGSLQKDMTAATTDIGSLQKDMTAATTDIGSLQKDMTAATTDIGSLQKDMTAATKDIGSLQKDMTAATTNIGSLQKDMTAATTDIGSLQKESSKNQQSQKKFDTLITDLQSRMGQANTAVFFNAKLREDLEVPGHTVVKLDQVVINTGGGYNPITGIFTAPQSGSYLFLATASGEAPGSCVYSSQKNAMFHIIADRQTVAGSWSRGCTSCTAHAVVSLQAGHQVCMETFNRVICSFRGNGYTSFCGVLLHPDMQ